LFNDAVLATGIAYADAGRSTPNAGAGEGRITAAAPSATAPATTPPIADPTTVFIMIQTPLMASDHQGTCHDFWQQNALIKGRISMPNRLRGVV
jgi:hypothetical protein